MGNIRSQSQDSVAVDIKNKYASERDVVEMIGQASQKGSLDGEGNLLLAISRAMKKDASFYIARLHSLSFCDFPA